jgi:hypothetical protein
MRDYTKMDQRKSYLRQLVASQPANVDQVKLLAIIRDKIMRFPD